VKLPAAALVCWLPLASGSAAAAPAEQAGASGRLALTWSVADAGGDPLSCRQAGAGQVEVRATAAATGQAYSTRLDCKAAAGTTGSLPLDEYTVVVFLLQAHSGEPIAQSQPRSAVVEEGATVDIGSFKLSTEVGW